MVAAKGITRGLQPLTAEVAAALPGQLGVYEVVAEGQTVVIAHAGGHEPFGLRSALTDAAERWPGATFRYETTHAYVTRWQELLMLHEAEHGRLPVANADDAHRIGGLT
ncbi:MAG: hypothetical protein AAF567_07515 [Actinomycetota bacterium]